MIEKHIRDYLRDDADIRDRVDRGVDFPGIYAGEVPQRHMGECILLNDVTAEHIYHLGGEVAPRETILQIGAYGSNAARAYSLAELVRDRLSGYLGLAGDSDETRILSCIIVASPGGNQEEPDDASDKWIHSYIRDYKIIHTTTVPTLT